LLRDRIEARGDTFVRSSTQAAPTRLKMKSGVQFLERFPAKWIPVRVKKTRQNKR